MKSTTAKRLASAHKELSDALSEADMHTQADHHLEQHNHYLAETTRLDLEEKANEEKRARHAAGVDGKQSDE